MIEMMICKDTCKCCIWYWQPALRSKTGFLPELDLGCSEFHRLGFLWAWFSMGFVELFNHSYSRTFYTLKHFSWKDTLCNRVVQTVNHLCGKSTFNFASELQDKIHWVPPNLILVGEFLVKDLSWQLGATSGWGVAVWGGSKYSHAPWPANTG